MTVYVKHRLSAGSTEQFQLEAFPSIERAASALQVRARVQRSTAYPLAVDQGSTQPWPWESHDFPGADRTGSMAVWLRKRPADLPPAPDEPPQERWTLTDGGAVQRQPWPEDMAPVQADPVPADALTPAQRRTKALAYFRETLPAPTAEFMAEIPVGFVTALEDLCQNDDLEDAVLRIVQGTR